MAPIFEEIDLITEGITTKSVSATIDRFFTEEIDLITEGITTLRSRRKEGLFSLEEIDLM